MNENKPTTMQNTLMHFKGTGEAFIIAGPTEPNGDPGLSYQGSPKQLKALYRMIKEAMKKEGIGNHPNR